MKELNISFDVPNPGSHEERGDQTIVMEEGRRKRILPDPCGVGCAGGMHKQIAGREVGCGVGCEAGLRGGQCNEIRNAGTSQGIDEERNLRFSFEPTTLVIWNLVE